MIGAFSSELSIWIGCAGWNLPAVVKDQFPPQGSHLQRYSHRLSAVEINTSFYRPHRHHTYSRWAKNVSSGFRFSVKVPRRITHELRLVGTASELREFLDQVSGLREKLGCLLIQLPPSLRFSHGVADEFLCSLRELTEAPVVLEPRHATWFSDSVNNLLHHYRVGRVAADPPPVSAANKPAGWRECVYYRLHGSPHMYYSSYPRDSLSNLAVRLRAATAESQNCWCIFDNTAAGAAWQNALEMCEIQARLLTHTG